MTFRILSCDGGGVRGIFSSRVVARLREMVPGFLDKVDLFAGTSTGSLLAAGLAAGMMPAELTQIYRDRSHLLFDRTLIQELENPLEGWRAKFGSAGRRQVLGEVFGDRRLGELERSVVIVAYQLDSGPGTNPRTMAPRVFHNFEGPDRDLRVADALLRSSAGPIYFPTYQGFVDGGVVANNPSMVAVAHALDPSIANRLFRDLRLLSIGTGMNPIYIEGQDLDWGWARWGMKLADMIMDGGEELVDHQCKHLLRERYQRIDVRLPRPIPLDAVSDIPFLASAADQVDLTAVAAWLKQEWESESAVE